MLRVVSSWMLGRSEGSRIGNGFIVCASDVDCEGAFTEGVVAVGDAVADGDLSGITCSD